MSFKRYPTGCSRKPAVCILSCCSLEKVNVISAVMLTAPAGVWPHSARHCQSISGLFCNRSGLSLPYSITTEDYVRLYCIIISQPSDMPVPGCDGHTLFYSNCYRASKDENHRLPPYLIICYCTVDLEEIMLLTHVLTWRSFSWPSSPGEEREEDPNKQPSA